MVIRCRTVTYADAAGTDLRCCLPALCAVASAADVEEELALDDASDKLMC